MQDQEKKAELIESIIYLLSDYGENPVSMDKIKSLNEMTIKQLSDYYIKLIKSD